MKRISPAMVGLMVLVCLLAVHAADKVGDFEISVQPQTQENSEIRNQGARWTTKTKEQRMCYRVRLQSRASGKLQNLKVEYIQEAETDPRGNSFEKGRRLARNYFEISEIAPLAKIDFTTEPIENTYGEANWGSGKVQQGKGGLKGITLRILNGSEVLAEYSQPKEMSSLWEEVEQKQERRQGKREGRGRGMKGE